MRRTPKQLNNENKALKAETAKMIQQIETLKLESATLKSKLKSAMNQTKNMTAHMMLRMLALINDNDGDDDDDDGDDGAGLEDIEENDANTEGENDDITNVILNQVHLSKKADAIEGHLKQTPSLQKTSLPQTPTPLSLQQQQHHQKDYQYQQEPLYQQRSYQQTGTFFRTC